LKIEGLRRLTFGKRKQRGCLALDALLQMSDCLVVRIGDAQFTRTTITDYRAVEVSECMCLRARSDCVDGQVRGRMASWLFRGDERGLRSLNPATRTVERGLWGLMSDDWREKRTSCSISIP